MSLEGIRRRYDVMLDSVAARCGRLGFVALGLVVRLVVLVMGGFAVGSVLGDRVGLDGRVARVVVEHRVSALTPAVRVVTTCGSSAVLVPVVLAGGVAWVARRTWWPMAVLASAYLGSIVVYDVVKVLVGRPRPTASQLVTATGYAFPSGHSMQAAAVGGSLALLGSAAVSGRVTRIALAVAAVAFALLVGLSRIYLGVHWTSDVIGGWALGALWLRGLHVAMTRLRGPGPTRGDGRPLRGSRR